MSAPSHLFLPEADTSKPITMYGPDFPFAYDDWLKHPSGLGSVPPPMLWRRGGHHRRRHGRHGGGL